MILFNNRTPAPHEETLVTDGDLKKAADEEDVLFKFLL
jgi:hypothetical protein